LSCSASASPIAFRFPIVVDLEPPPFEEENDRFGVWVFGLGAVGLLEEEDVSASSSGLDDIAFGSGSGGKPLSITKKKKALMVSMYEIQH